MVFLSFLHFSWRCPDPVLSIQVSKIWRFLLVNLTTLSLAEPGSFIAYFIQRLESPHLRDLRIQIKGRKGCTPELVLTMMLDSITGLNLHGRLESLELSLKKFQLSKSILPVFLQTPKFTSFFTDFLTLKIVKFLISNSRLGDSWSSYATNAGYRTFFSSFVARHH